jgi:acyl carrier protein
VEQYLFGRDSDLGKDDSFMERGLLDSTGILELVSFIERTYGFHVEDDELVPENLDSIERAAKYVLRKQSVDGMPVDAKMPEVEHATECAWD